MKPIRLFKRDGSGRVPKVFFFEKPNETMSLFKVLFKELLKHDGEVFVCSG